MNGIIRFAPSPTGYLHEGHLLSALYVWAAARKWNLNIILRIENHDLKRSRDEYIKSILEDLKWFGFKWDTLSIQSEHSYIYEKFFNILTQNNLIYPCFCSRKQLELENPKSITGEIIYQGKCNSSRELNFLELNKISHNLRVKITDKVIHWYDHRLGYFNENPKLQCGDFPIRDRDLQWTYQFAVCVDDIHEKITHIVRGEDIRNSTARQIALMRLLGKEDLPFYLHHKLIVDDFGKKLSKREMPHSLRQDIVSGISLENLLGKVCFKSKLIPSFAPLSLETAISIVESHL